MENNAHGQIVLDAHRSAPFEYRREEVYPLPANNGVVSSAWRGTIGERLASFREINWIKPDAKYNPVIAVFCSIGCTIGIGLMALVALLTHSPFVFPSLGPTAFLFFSSPTAPAASPRNAIIGHTIGILAGYFSIVVTGLTMAGPALQVGVTIPRIIAIALSLSLTGGLMVLFRALHPPAGATTLMVSLGILAKPWQLAMIMGAVVLLTLFAVLFNRLVGIPYPLWKTVSPEVRNPLWKTVSPEVSSGITVESSLWACCTGIGGGEGNSDINFCSNGQSSKREGLPRVKRTHDPLWETVSHEVRSEITVESSLWACCTGIGGGEGSSDINFCSNGQSSKREGLPRIKRTHVRLVPL